MSGYNSYYLNPKRQKFSENSDYNLLSNVISTKNDFLMEINGNSESNLNRDMPSWIKYDLIKTKKQIDLFGHWSIGINACVIGNSINSWKNAQKSNTDFPSLSFIKIGVKLEGKSTKIIGIKYLQNRLYSKPKVIA